MIFIPRRKTKIKFKRKIACIHLEPAGDVSNCLQPLCICSTRDLMLGSHGSSGAYVCQVCEDYDPNSNVTFNEVYKKSKKIAEKKIPIVKEIEIKELEVELLEDIDLDVSEFEEEEDEESKAIKFKKRSKGTSKGSKKEINEMLTSECPYCGEFFEDLSAHKAICEFAPSKSKMIKTRGRKPKPPTEKPKDEQKGEVCPYCGKTFLRLSRHKCKKAPKK
ncbi:MAG: hypothetical protein KAX10_08710 [Candidatus Lokiarchaeota archaeon]|nr:hypothetical protein [Candidatus Lokiarchaeota archaeon]